MKKTRYIKPLIAVLSAEAVVMSAASPEWDLKDHEDDFGKKEGDVINDFDESPTNWGKND